MTSQEWEKYHKEEDLKLQKEIRRLSRKSTRRLYLGVLSFVLIVTSIGNAFNQAAKLLETVPDEMAHEAMLGVFDGAFFLQLLLLAALGIFLLFRSAALWNRSEELSEQRYFWMPAEEEKKDIEARFDNDFVRYLLTKISLRNTESVKVSLDGINIRNNTGDRHCNLNRNGFRRLTNYETKQLAYFIAEKAFTEGYTIYQSKKYETIYERYIGGVTDVGGGKAARKSRLSTIRKDVIWLSSQISSIMRVKNPIPVEQKVSGPGMIEGGNIILNKGYRQDDSEYKAL